jgi:hypothetical protein
MKLECLEVPVSEDYPTPRAFTAYTGVNDMSICSKLHIYYGNGPDGEMYTYVAGEGEYSNPDGWKYKGKVSPELVLQQYMEDVKPR